MSLYVSDVAEIERVLNGDKGAAIVLYCNGPFCGKSSRLAEELIQLASRYWLDERDAVEDLNLSSASPTSRRAMNSARHIMDEARWSPARLEELIANVARFSKKDAQTFRDWNRKAEKIMAQIFPPDVMPSLLLEQEREALLSRTALGREFLDVSSRQPLMSYASCSRMSTCNCCSCSRCRCLAPGSWTRCRRHRPWAR